MLAVADQLEGHGVELALRDVGVVGDGDADSDDAPVGEGRVAFDGVCRRVMAGVCQRSRGPQAECDAVGSLDRIVHFRARTIFSILGILLAVGVVLYVLWVARHVLSWLLIALFLALALNPAVEWLQRHGSSAAAQPRDDLPRRDRSRRRLRLPVHPDARRPGEQLREQRARLCPRPDEGTRTIRFPRDEVPHRRARQGRGVERRRLEVRRRRGRGGQRHEERADRDCRDADDRVHDLLHAPRGPRLDGADLRPRTGGTASPRGGRSAATSTAPLAATSRATS